MIIVLNGYPGVGKLTIGRELIDQIEGRLLDIHTVYNVAFALTEFKSPEFRATVEKIEKIAHDLIYKLPPRQPVVLTTVLAGNEGDSDWGDDEWGRIEELGKMRPPLCVVHVHCDLKENIERIKSVQRDRKRKIRDPDMALRNQTEAKPLYGMGASYLLKLDTTGLTPHESAATIAEWLPEVR